MQVHYSAISAGLVMYIACKHDNVCKHLVTIVALELILMAIYACACVEYTLAELAVKAGELPAQTALFDDNIILIEQTISVIIGLILTIGAPWGGILNGLLDFSARCVLSVSAMVQRLVHHYPDTYICKHSLQTAEIALQGKIQ